MTIVRPFKIDHVHIWIKCPYCGKTHLHGSCGGSHYAGFRAPHCENGFDKPDYYIQEAQLK